MTRTIRSVVLLLLLAVVGRQTEYCPKGSFKLHSMNACHSFLQCGDIETLRLIDEIGHGAVKTVYLSSWKGNPVAISKLRNIQYVLDFKHNWKMLVKLQGPFIVQPLGYCNANNTILTEYHPRGNIVQLIENLEHYNFNSVDPLQRIRFCWMYAKILEKLHAEKLVNCDSNSLDKILSQILLSLDGQFVLNDLDALAENEVGVTCGRRPLYGEFVAPEQVGLPLPRYDEKTDIWKAASVCEYFLSNLTDVLPVYYHFYDTHKRCKSSIPSLRPTATELVDLYSNALIRFRDEL